MKGKAKIGIVTILGVVALLLFLFNSPFGKESNGFVTVLYKQAEDQAKDADNITDGIVAPLEGEGKLTGSHEDSGSNWSIPNIIRHIMIGE